MRNHQKKIKILQVISSLHIGGAEKVVSNISTLINKDIFEMEVLCIKELGMLGEKLVNEGIEVLIPKGNHAFLDRYRKVLRINSIVLGRQYDIVHTHGTTGLLTIGPLFCFRSKKPIFLHTFHFGNYPNIKRRYLYGERFFASFADCLVAVSHSQRESIVRYHRVKPEKIRTIINGVEDNKYCQDKIFMRDKFSEFGITEKDFIVGSIAVLSIQKGIIYLLDAAREISKRIQNVKFLIVGGGKMLEYLKERAFKLGLREKVIFTGWRSDALKILSAFDIFVSPSLWEGLPLAILEAMAARKPIVATMVGDNPKIIDHGKTGLLIPAESPDAIKDAILQIASNPDHAKDMGENAYRRYREDFTVDKMVKSYEKLYLDSLSYSV